jgi:hypothetical protein
MHAPAARTLRAAPLQPDFPPNVLLRVVCEEFVSSREQRSDHRKPTVSIGLIKRLVARMPPMSRLRGRANVSKCSIEGLAYQLGPRPPLKSAAHDPKQDAQADINRQLYILYGQAFPNPRLSEIRLKIARFGLRAAPKTVDDRRFHEFSKGEGYASDRIWDAEPGRRRIAPPRRHVRLESP